MVVGVCMDVSPFPPFLFVVVVKINNFDAKNIC